MNNKQKTINRKNILLITYYWPPAGGAGVQRWLKMVKYLSQNHQITVYTPENAHYPLTDNSLLNDVPENVKVVRTKIWEPYGLAVKINKKNKAYQKGHIEDKEKQSFLSRISLYIRANYFVPDARKFWINPSVKFLINYLNNHPTDIIITTGPPHSMHCIGLKLKQKFPDLFWLSDFRDPWTQIDYIDQLPLTKSALKKQQKMELSVLQTADVVTTVSPSWAKDLKQLSDRKVEVIYNGFDQKDFSNLPQPEKALTFTYVGSLNSDRNPRVLWNVLNKFCQENSAFSNAFQLNLIGSIAQEVQAEIESLPNLKPKTIFIDYLPHSQAIEHLAKSQVLLLLINQTANQKGIIPGKLFEYLAAQRFVFCLGNSKSDIAELLEQTQSGTVVPFSDKMELRNALKQIYNAYQQQKLIPSNQSLSSFTREFAAEKVNEIILKNG